MSVTSLQQLLNFIQIILIEISTRNLGNFNAIWETESKDHNISELLNETFIINENVRNELKKLVTSTQLEFSKENKDNMITLRVMDETVHKLQDILNFQAKWAVAYQNWLSSFKASRENRQLLISGNSNTYLDYQTLFPSITPMLSDLETLLRELYLFREELQRRAEVISNILLIQRKPWWWKFNNYEFVKATKRKYNEQLC